MRNVDRILRLASHFEALAIGLSSQEAKQILGLPEGFDKDQLTKAYRKNVLQFHPDVNKDPDATIKTQKINAAYEKLKGEVSSPIPPTSQKYEWRWSDYDREDEEKEKAPTFVVDVRHYVSAEGGRSYSPHFDKTDFDRRSKKKFTNIREAINFINETTKLDKNQAISLIKETPGRGSIKEEYLALVKYDHVDNKWYTVPPMWRPTSEEDREHPHRNPHRSWSDFSHDLLREHSEQYQL